MGNMIRTANVSGSGIAIGDNATAYSYTTINQILQKDEITNEVTLLAYLKRVQIAADAPTIGGTRQDGEAPTEALTEVLTEAAKIRNSELAKLWHEEFTAHLPGEASSSAIPLWALAQEVCARARRHGQPQRILLSAQAGQGKSGALHSLMCERARLSLRNYKAEQTLRVKKQGLRHAMRTFILPIFVDLGELPDSDLSIEELISKSFNRALEGALQESEIDHDEADLITLGEVDLLLTEYSCFFLFDNLDALIAKGATAKVRMVRKFLSDHAQHQVVIACRPTHYQNQLGSLHTVLLNQLSDQQVLDILSPTTLRRIRKQTHLLILARNRSHLRTIIELTDRRSLVQNLVSKGHLLQLLEQQKLSQQFGDDDSSDFDQEAAEEVLERLALAMVDGNNGICTDTAARLLLKEFLDEWEISYGWRNIMFALKKTGYIHRVGRRSWAFTDRKSEAYFVAAALLEAPHKIGAYLNTLIAPRWVEVLEIFIGLSKSPEELIEQLIREKYVVVAAHCAQFSGQALESRTIKHLIAQLVESMKIEHGPRRAEIALQIGESREAAALPSLLKVMFNETRSVALQAIVKAVWVCLDYQLSQSSQPAEESPSAVGHNGTNLTRREANAVEKRSQIARELLSQALREIVEEHNQALQKSSRQDDHPEDASDLLDANMVLEILTSLYNLSAEPPPPAKWQKQLFKIGTSPKEHRIVRGLALFNLGLIASETQIANSSLSYSGRPIPSKEEIERARNLLLTYLEEHMSAEDNDDLFVAWCCADALGDVDHDSVITTALRVCKPTGDESRASVELRAQAVYLMGIVGRRTPHKHMLVAQALRDILKKDETLYNYKIIGYAAEAVQKLWIDLREEPPQPDEDEEDEEGHAPPDAYAKAAADRRQAAHYLVEALDYLEAILAQSHHSWLRRKIAEALGEIGSTKSLELLETERRHELARMRTLRQAIEKLRARRE